MEVQPLTDTREGIESERAYLYFDVAIDQHLAGECSLEEALQRYRTLLGEVALAPSAE
jgi:hypothetical protein